MGARTNRYKEQGLKPIKEAALKRAGMEQAMPCPPLLKQGAKKSRLKPG